MTMPIQPILLWPQGAPDALGNGPEDTPRLTPFIPTGPGPFGAVVVCPGGGYGGRAQHEHAPVAEWLCGLGVAAFVLVLRVAPYRYPIPQNDAKRALRYLRATSAEWHLDPHHLGILGFSAGGHLAACTATLFDAGDPFAVDPIERESSRPDALIACYPVISSGEFGHQGSFLNLLGDPPPVALLHALSLETRVTVQNPPTFLWHTSDDAGVPVENSLLFAMALRHHGVPFALHSFTSGAHGLGLALDHPTAHAWTSLCAGWLQEQGFISE